VRARVAIYNSLRVIMRYKLCSATAAFTLALMVIMDVSGYACTTFIVGERDSQLFGRNYDWGFGDGYVIVNKKGVHKEAFKSRIDGENGQPATWTSRFGSVTFNQYGREFPQGGMNEAGLIVETMALSSTKFPASDSRPYLPNALLWRQYLLDTCSSVRDVIESDSKVRISYDASRGIGIHLQILDRDGNAAIIEFLEGKTVVYTDESLPVKALSNDTYQESLEYWKTGTSPIWDSGNSIERFTTAANFVQNQSTAISEPSLEQTFDYLGRVASHSTRWSIAYDNRGMKIHLRTDGNARIRTIDVAKFDFSCKTPVMALNINDNLAGDVTHNFQNYDPETNIRLVKTSFGKLGSRVQVPDRIVEFLGKYPQQCKCQE